MARRRSFPGLILLLCTLAFAGVTAAQEGSAPGSSSSLLGPGDVVRTTVFGMPDLSGVMRIGEDGRISFPLIGEVMLGGLSPGQAEEKIATLLADGGYVRNPQVNLFIEQRQRTLENSVLILGQVVKPGKYPLHGVSEEGVETLVDLLAVAGGTNGEASDRVLLLRRDGENVHRMHIDLMTLLAHGELQQNVGLIGGDIVFVPETEVFYIFGQVQNPGRYRLERDMSVMQAISVGGGIGPLGSERGIRLKRRVDDDVRTYTVGLDDELRPNDVVYVRESLF